MKRAAPVKPRAVPATPPEKTTLYVVELQSYVDVGVDPIRIREFTYSKTEKTLTSAPGHTDAPEPPLGLRRIPVNKLPAVGGIFGLAVADVSREKAIAVLLNLAIKKLTEVERAQQVLTLGIATLNRTR